ncbi:MAG: cation:proton antiporter [Thermomicrobiales bacterium]|nr:cation:proton antiporter [Thermomicrobiales bacterium]
MTFNLLVLVAGALFVVMAMSGSVLKRLPLTTSLVYLTVGYLLVPRAAGLLDIDIMRHASIVERLTEIAVIVSLFTAGLKLRVDWRDPLWRLPLRLAFGSMAITVALIAAVAAFALDLSLGAAILLGAVLAPTDPVLASDVQVSDPQDQDRLRFGLTGEAGLNDGAAFPFVMLGLGLLGHHELGAFGLRWLAVDLIWATIGGIAVGLLLGTGIGYLVLYFRQKHKETTGLDDFLTLGLIALSYASALLIHTYGFLAVFAAGLALRRIEQRATGADLDAVTRELEVGDDSVAVEPKTAPAYMAQALLGFNEQLERVGEVAVVVLVGAMLTGNLGLDAIWFVPLLLLVVRPIAVAVGLIGSRTVKTQRWLMAWFGIRGIGSLYYLSYAIVHGLEETTAMRLAELTLAAIAISVVIHGVSVTPLMRRYEHDLDDTRQSTAGAT